MWRGYVHDAAQNIVDHYEASEMDVLLHVLPAHHATSSGVLFFLFLIAGFLIEFAAAALIPCGCGIDGNAED